MRQLRVIEMDGIATKLYEKIKREFFKEPTPREMANEVARLSKQWEDWNNSEDANILAKYGLKNSVRADRIMTPQSTKDVDFFISQVGYGANKKNLIPGTNYRLDIRNKMQSDISFHQIKQLIAAEALHAKDIEDLEDRVLDFYDKKYTEGP